MRVTKESIGRRSSSARVCGRGVSEFRSRSVKTDKAKADAVRVAGIVREARLPEPAPQLLRRQRAGIARGPRFSRRKEPRKRVSREPMGRVRRASSARRPERWQPRDTCHARRGGGRR